MMKKILFVLALILVLLVSNGRFSVSIATWISAAMLLYAVRRLSVLKGFFFAWVLLTLAWSFQFHGMVPVPAVFYVVIALTYGFIASLPYLLDALLNKRPTGFAGTLIFPAAWAFVDYLTVFTPYGSWGMAAYSQHTQLVLLQSISVFGMCYITFLIGWFASVANWALANGMDWQKIRRGIAVYAGLLVLTLGFGGLRLVLKRPDSPTIRVASLSAIPENEQTRGPGMPAVPRKRVKRTPGLEKRMFANQLTEEDKAYLTRNAEVENADLFRRSAVEAKAGAKLILWGEANSSAFKSGEPALFEKAAAFAKSYHVYLGLGAAVFKLGAQKPLENKLVMFDPQGKILFDYWKVHPVPGGEARISAVKGDTLPVVDTSFGKLGAAICFDMDFPNFLKQASHADVFIAPSNDWRAIDPWHTYMATYRAIEQGFNLIRQTSHGLSVGVDYTGRVISETDYFTSADKVLITELPTRGVTTVYSKIGDSFAWFCLLLLIAVPLYSRARKPA